MSLSITERLANGTVLGAEGYVFELERRGYIKAGPFVPEVVLDFPDAVRELHREFLRAGAEVMVALTYYAHREKLRDVGREADLEAMNRQAVRIAREVAREGDALVAGNVCNTWAYDPDDPATGETVRAMYAEAARLGGRGGHQLRHLGDQRLPGRGADRGGGHPGTRAARDGDAGARRSPTRPATATRTRKRAGSSPPRERRSSG